MMTFNRLVSLSALAVLTSSWGCASYVNIPSQTSDVANHNPNHASVLEVERHALAAVTKHYEMAQPFTVRPLPNTAPPLYFEMARKIHPHATVDSIAGAPLIEVKRLHIRGWDAQVDVVHHPTQILANELAADTDLEAAHVTVTASDDSRQAITVSLEYRPFSGWRAKRVKVWRADVDQALLTQVHHSQVYLVP